MPIVDSKISATVLKRSFKSLDPNKQSLPLKFAQNFTVQWADFRAISAELTYRSESMLKKHTKPNKKVS